MEVTKVSTAVSHVVIGGQESMQMGITESPEFYQMLSQALYRNPKLAVIRETICNMWDAHKLNGHEGPAEITINSDKMVFRDFGPGISKEKIIPIYGVYGNSTKRGDNNATGGFGLGCKSPFAYQDHFQVVSNHEGERTIYRMAKSNGAIKGKPSITPIVTVPTTETGLEVTIDIKNETDRYHFEQYINQIVVNAGVPTKINGDLVNGIDYSQAKRGYLISSDVSGYGRGEILLLKLGDVVYPISKEPEYALIYDQLIHFMSRTVDSNNYKLVLLAEPGSITITPSREALTGETNETVRKMMEDVYADLRRGIEPHFKPLSRKLSDFTLKYVDGAGEYRRNSVMTSPTYLGVDVANAFSRMGIRTNNLTSKESIAAAMMVRSLSTSKITEDYLYRLGKMSKYFHDTTRVLLPKVIKELSHLKDYDTPTDIVQRIFVRHFMRLNPKIPFDSIHIVNYHRHRAYRSKGWEKDSDAPLIPNDLGKQTLEPTIHMFNPVVVLYRRERGLRDRIVQEIREDDRRRTRNKDLPDQPPEVLKYPENIHGNVFFAIKAPSTAKGLEEFREILKDTPYVFIDAVGKFDWEERKAAKRPGIRNTAKKKPSEVYALKSILDEKESRVNHHYAKSENHIIQLETAPEFYVEISLRGNNGQRTIGDLKIEQTLKFVTAYGMRGCIVSTEAQKKKAISLGAVTFNQFLRKEVENSVKDRFIRRSFAYDSQAYFQEKLNFNTDRPFYDLLESKFAKKLMGIKLCELTVEQQLLKELLIHRCRPYYREQYVMPSHVVKLVRNLSERSWAKQLTTMRDVCRTSELLEVLKLPALDALIQKGNTQATTLLTTALKG